MWRPPWFTKKKAQFIEGESWCESGKKSHTLNFGVSPVSHRLPSLSILGPSKDFLKSIGCCCRHSSEARKVLRGWQLTGRILFQKIQWWGRALVLLEQSSTRRFPGIADVRVIERGSCGLAPYFSMSFQVKPPFIGISGFGLEILSMILRINLMLMIPIPYQHWL